MTGSTDRQPGVAAGLVVADMEAQRRFYVEILGLPVLDDRSYPSGTRIVELGGPRGRLKLNRPEPPPTTPPHGGAHRDALGLRYVSVYVGDADLVHTRLQEEGVPLLGERRSSSAGEVFFVRDAEGTVVEVVQPR